MDLDVATEPSSPPSGGGGGGDFFDCNICLETASDPVITLCGHLYCWPCIYQWMSARHAHATCPVCKVQLSEERIIPIYGRGRTPRSAESCSASGGSGRSAMGGSGSDGPGASPPSRANDPGFGEVVDRSSCNGCISSAGLSPTAAHYRRHPASPPRPPAATSPRRDSGRLDPYSPPRTPLATTATFAPDVMSPLLGDDSSAIHYPSGGGTGLTNNSFFGTIHGLLTLFGIHLTPIDRSGQEVAVAALSPEQAQQAYLSRLLLLLGSFVILCLLLI